jgi:PAS domain S-box-containing protein
MTVESRRFRPDSPYVDLRAGQADPSAWPVDTLLESIDAAVVATDMSGQIFYCNEAATRTYGHTREAMVGASVMDLFVDPMDEQSAIDIMASVLAGRSWSGDFRVRSADGSLRTMRITDSPLIRDGRVVGVIGVGTDVTDRLGTEEDAATAARRLTQLSRVIAELTAARDMDAVVEIVVSHAADALGADLSSMTVLSDPGTLTLVGLRGAPVGTAQRWASFPLTEQVPIAEAARTGRPLVLTGRDAITRAYPALETAAPGERSMICLPLQASDGILGVIGLSFSGLRAPDAQEMEFLTTLADTCGQAIERFNALAEATNAADKLRFVAEVSAELAGSLDYPTTLRKVASLVVPTVADWCALDIVEDGRLNRLAVAHVDPVKVEFVKALEERYPTDPDAATGATNVVRTGRSQLYRDVTEEMLVAGTVDAEHLRLSRELGLRSGLIVPLEARGRVLGALTLVWAESDRRYDESDLAFAEELARRAATAIDNAQLHSQTLEAAVQLQRAVLPDSIAEIPGWETAVHYNPSGRTEVGGDFYDAVPLGDGRMAVVVGDVMGRGVAAAAAMAQMRATLRAYIAIDPDPQTVVANLDRMFETFRVAQFVTLVYVLADPEAGNISFVNAGHLPPLVVLPGATAVPLTARVSLPLGAGPDNRTATTVEFPTGATLLAFTDGLVERRGEDIDVGLDRLVDLARHIGDDPLDDWLGRIIHALGDGDRDDDVTALAVRRTD